MRGILVGIQDTVVIGSMSIFQKWLNLSPVAKTWILAEEVPALLLTEHV